MKNADPIELEKFAKLAKEWWDLDGSLKTLHDINPARMAFITQSIALQDCKILDVGCGGGILAEAMASHGATVTGIDLEKNAIHAARHHAKAKQYSVDYGCVSITDFKENNFDAVTCMELLEHVPNPEDLIADCTRKLKSGGLLFLSTINRAVKAYTHAILGAEYLLKLLPKQTHDYKKFIKPSELAGILRQNGLELVKLSGMNYNPLSRQATLGHDVSVNYLIAARKD